MARQRGPARRPSAPPAAPPRQQTRQSTTAAAPPHHQAHNPTAQAPPSQATQASSGPGLMGQMASTAAGVAIGSTVGNALGNMFFGGSSAQPAEASAAAPVDNTYNQTAWNSAAEAPCANDISRFTKCMTDNNGSLPICEFYLDQLKACQAAAERYQ